MEEETVTWVKCKDKESNPFVSRITGIWGCDREIEYYLAVIIGGGYFKGSLEK